MGGASGGGGLVQVGDHAPSMPLESPSSAARCPTPQLLIFLFVLLPSEPRCCLFGEPRCDPFPEVLATPARADIKSTHFRLLAKHLRKHGMQIYPSRWWPLLEFC